MKFREFLSSLEISPLALRGLLLLGAILMFLIFERVSAYNSDLQERQRSLQTQLAQLKTIQNSEDPQALLKRAKDQAEVFEAAFLSEETTGLNTAKFQVELVSILEACGAEQTVIDIAANEAEDVANISILEANVRMQGTLITASRCLHGINESSIRMDVASMRWTMPQQFLVQIRGYALMPSEAGS